MKQRFLIAFLALAFTLSICNFPTFATSSEKRDTDGTLILSSYPVLPGTIEKQNQAKAIMIQK